MALAAQALEAQKADKPLEQGGALEQVAARIERVMGLTPKLTGKTAVAKRRRVFPVQRLVRHAGTHLLRLRVSKPHSANRKKLLNTNAARRCHTLL